MLHIPYTIHRKKERKKDRQQSQIGRQQRQIDRQAETIDREGPRERENIFLSLFPSS